MRRAVIVIAVSAALLVRIGVAAAVRANDEPEYLGRIAAPVPDCGKVLCVVPLVFLNEWAKNATALTAEVERLRKELAEAQRTKKCAKLEVNS